MGYGIQNYGSSSGLPWENRGPERRWDAAPLEEEPKKKAFFKKDLSWGHYALMGVACAGLLGLGPVLAKMMYVPPFVPPPPEDLLDGVWLGIGEKPEDY